jgi:salicylate hydroxylase
MLILVSAGIGLGPNGLRAMDLMEPGFRAKYEKICVGNKSLDAQHVFFEGLLLQEGLGMHTGTLSSEIEFCLPLPGLDQPWYGKSMWGHPDFNRRSVRHPMSSLHVIV